MSATGRTTIRLAVSLTPEAATFLLARYDGRYAGPSLPNALAITVQQALRDELGPGAALVWPLEAPR